MKPLFALVQPVLPHHLISRFIGALANSKWPPLKRLLISKVMKWYNITLDDYVQEDPGKFATFNEFFTRALKPAARPIDASDDAVIAPVDGYISQLGHINNGQIFQAKDKIFSAQSLLGCEQLAAKFTNGEFATLYLAPNNYHRIHMPVAGTLKSMRYIPGRLFSVNNQSVNNIERLFARNERVVCEFTTNCGPMVLVMVGALNVGSIETVHEGPIAPGQPREQKYWSYAAEQQPAFEKAQELGRFNLGSTVILLFAEGQISWQKQLGVETPIQLGEALAHMRDKDRTTA